MQGTLADDHLSMQDTLARDHVSTQGTLAREHVKHAIKQTDENFATNIGLAQKVVNQ